MRRREFIALLGGAAATISPFAARAQQREMRRIGILMTLPADDPVAQARIQLFVRSLQDLGWAGGTNATFDIRWNAFNPESRQKDVADLVAQRPDVILTTGSVTMGPLLQATRSIPIVFVIVPDPVGEGYIESLARPGGNATGFLQFEFALSGKWLEVLKELVPGHTSRVGVLRDPSLTTSIAQFAAIQGVALSLRTELITLNARTPGEIESAVAAFARAGPAGLIVTSSPFTATNRALIIALAAQHKLPAVYYESYMVEAGGLISYGPDFLDQYRQAVTCH